MTDSDALLDLDISPATTPDDLRAFKVLNEQWLFDLGVLNEHDRSLLGNPGTAIIDAGGEILAARRQGRVVGCAALVPYGEGTFELATRRLLDVVADGLRPQPGQADA